MKDKRVDVLAKQLAELEWDEKLGYWVREDDYRSWGFYTLIRRLKQLEKLVFALLDFFNLNYEGVPEHYELRKKKSILKKIPRRNNKIK